MLMDVTRVQHGCRLVQANIPSPPEVGAGETAEFAEDIVDLLQEVEMLTKLRHPNCVCFAGAGVCAGYMFLVMEFVSGGSLLSVIGRFGAVPLSSARRYLRDMLCGLHFLHGHGTVHRDMKPANVLLEIDGTCKVADFGASADLSKAAA
eukprot:gene38251-biopygen116280